MTSLALEDLRPYYAFCDPHGGKRDVSHKRLSSRAAIVVVGVDTLGRIFALSSWADRCSTDALIERIYETNEKFRPKVFGIEANGLQALFGDAIRRDARLAGKRLPLMSVIQPTTQEKDFRIRTTLQPLIGNGRLFLRRDDATMLDLQHEITTFPTNPVKDAIDALASAVRMVPPRSVRRVRDQENLKLVEYLRNSGAHPSAIEAAAKRVTTWH